jgi:hypothetical protein
MKVLHSFPIGERHAPYTLHPDFHLQMLWNHLPPLRPEDGENNLRQNMESTKTHDAALSWKSKLHSNHFCEQFLSYLG